MVKKIIQVSCTQFYNILSVQCTVCSPSQMHRYIFVCTTLMSCFKFIVIGIHDSHWHSLTVLLSWGLRYIAIQASPVYTIIHKYWGPFCPRIGYLLHIVDMKDVG